eukprot:TRINITY_DN27349_c0_g6_i1.p1 TRINITY_DN27349_c0_g6~~TRINITY_DN27349_c0_g6_i1.p1  ORF type:complete len:498 (-),score=84.79 TRINITY_DN27349_c0_g6_i1:144-1481(-)
MAAERPFPDGAVAVAPKREGQSRRERKRAVARKRELRGGAAVVPEAAEAAAAPRAEADADKAGPLFAGEAATATAWGSVASGSIGSGGYPSPCSIPASSPRGQEDLQRCMDGFDVECEGELPVIHESPKAMQRTGSPPRGVDFFSLGEEASWSSDWYNNWGDLGEASATTTMRGSRGPPFQQRRSQADPATVDFSELNSCSWKSNGSGVLSGAGGTGGASRFNGDHAGMDLYELNSLSWSSRGSRGSGTHRLRERLMEEAEHERALNLCEVNTASWSSTNSRFNHWLPPSGRRQVPSMAAVADNFALLFGRNSSTPGSAAAPSSAIVQAHAASGMDDPEGVDLTIGGASASSVGGVAVAAAEDASIRGGFPADSGPIFGVGSGHVASDSAGGVAVSQPPAVAVSQSSDAPASALSELVSPDGHVLMAIPMSKMQAVAQLLSSGQV